MMMILQFPIFHGLLDAIMAFFVADGLFWYSWSDYGCSFLRAEVLVARFVTGRGGGALFSYD